MLIKMLKLPTFLCVLVLAAAAPTQLPIDKYNHLHKLAPGPSIVRCGTGHNTQECPAKYKCTAPPNCERYVMGVYYEGCIGTCVPDT